MQEMINESRMTRWEQVAQTRWGAYITKIEQRAILQAHRMSRQCGTALEVGCEGGRWAKLLTDLGWKMVCTDVDPEVMEICRSKIPTATCILANPRDAFLPCETDSTDLLLCIEVWPVVDSHWFLPEAYRVLRKGGLLLGVFLNENSMRGQWARARDWLYGSSHGVQRYQLSYRSMQTMLKTRSFSVVYEEGFAWAPFTRSSDSPFVPVFAFFERVLGLRRLPNLSPWVVFIAQKNL